MAEVRIDGLDPDDVAAHWLAAVEPSISVARSETGIVLHSTLLTVDRIKDAWLCVATNERLLVANAEARQHLLAELIE